MNHLQFTQVYEAMVQYFSNLDKVVYDIEQKIDQMEGDFVVRPNTYEQYFCDLLGWECIDNRYYDASVR
jgi:hypothetical protein